MTEVDLAHGLLDHQLVDSDGRRCGKVDDLDLNDGLVVAILSGPVVWRGRGRLGRFAALIGRGHGVRVPWSEVEKIDSAVRLRRTARELRLGRGDDRARPLVERIPGSSL